MFTCPCHEDRTLLLQLFPEPSDYLFLNRYCSSSPTVPISTKSCLSFLYYSQSIQGFWQRSPRRVIRITMNGYQIEKIVRGSFCPDGLKTFLGLFRRNISIFSSTQVLRVPYRHYPYLETVGLVGPSFLLKEVGNPYDSRLFKADSQEP